MSRLQLALNVTDIDTAVDFYSRLFATQPHKRKPGYANFEVADPPLKLVLIEHAAAAGSVNHLGVEVATTDEVHAHTARLTETGLLPTIEDDVTCCHAVQDKAWVTAPDGEAWEVYAITDDAPAELATAAAGGACCT